MSLTSLPDDLIYDIAKTLSLECPDDIEKIGRTCARFRCVVWPLVEEHRKAIKAYSKLDCHSVGAADFFFTICKKPARASYPRTLEVSANRQLRTLERGSTAKQIALVNAFKAKRDTVSDEDIEAAIARTGLIPQDQTSRWIEGIRAGDEDYLFAILLVSLPKLKRFVIHLDLEKMEVLKEMVRTIDKEWTRRPSLPDLVNVQVRERDGARDCDLELLPLLASIPGVQSLHASVSQLHPRHPHGSDRRQNLTGLYRKCFRGDWLSYPGASPSITSVTLETCGMSVEGLEMLMQSLYSLKKFHYVAHRAGWGIHAVSSLLKNSLDSLETLVISTGSGSSRYIGRLKAFTALKHLTVDTDMLIRDGKMQRFIDIMPKSLETCTLAGNSLTKPRETRLLADMLRTDVAFPYLRRISVEDTWGMRNIGQLNINLQREMYRGAMARASRSS